MVLRRSESSSSSVALGDFPLPKHYRHLLFKGCLSLFFKEIVKEISDPKDGHSHPLVFLLAPGKAHDTGRFLEISVMLQPRALQKCSKTRGSGFGE